MTDTTDATCPAEAATTTEELPAKDPFAAPAGAVMPYIPKEWQQFAVRADSLVIDVDENVKLHGDKDLAAQQASLKDWDFTRPIVVRRANRQVIIGNGSVLAAIRNGWEYIPVHFRDVTEQQARVMGATDNMVGTQALWNEKALAKLQQEVDGLDLGALEMDIDALCGDVLGRLKVIEDETEDQAAPPAEPAPVGKKAAISVELVHRIIVICPDEASQIRKMSELMNEGFDCRVSTVRAN